MIVGFTLGAAVLLVLDQLKNLLGLPAAGTGEDHFLKRVWLTLSHIDQTNRAALLHRPGNDRHRARAALVNARLTHPAAGAAAGGDCVDRRGLGLEARPTKA